MKLVTKITMALAAAMLLAAIWLPGHWWQWLGTAVVVTVIAAVIESEGGRSTDAGSDKDERDRDPRYP